MPRLTRLLVVVFGLFMLSSAACFADVRCRLASAQEGDPVHPRAIVLVHGTNSSDVETWKDFITWWSQPQQDVLRQMYAVYALDYSGQDTTVTAPGTATAFVKKLQNAEPGSYLEPTSVSGTGGTIVSVGTWSYFAGKLPTLPSCGEDQRLNAYMLTGGQVELRRIWAGEVPAKDPPSGSVDVRKLWGGYEEVILVGHSQGGLVAKELAVQSLNSGDGSNPIKLKQLIYLGTPHDGIPLSIGIGGKGVAWYQSASTTGNRVSQSVRTLEPALFSSGPSQAIAAIGLAADTVAAEYQYVADCSTGFAAIQYMYDLNWPFSALWYHQNLKEPTWRARNAVIGRQGIEECVIRGIWTLFPKGIMTFLAATSLTTRTDGIVPARSAIGRLNGPCPLSLSTLDSCFPADRLVDIVVGNVTKNTLHEQLTVDTDVFARIRDFVTRNNGRYATIKASWDMVTQKYAVFNVKVSDEAMFRALWVWRAVDGRLSDAVLTAKIGESLQGNSSGTGQSGPTPTPTLTPSPTSSPTPFPNRLSPTPSTIGFPAL